MTITKEQIRARRSPSEERARKVTKEIESAFQPRQAEFNQRLFQLVTQNSSVKKKLFGLHEVMSEVREVAHSYSPCKKGCHKCCYQRVLLTQTEANVIGEAIGVRAKILPITHTPRDEQLYGPETPCVFLKSGECAIYARRPIQCRNYVNLDVDDLLCSFENWALVKTGENVGIPMMGATPVLEAYNMICRNGRDVRGDIRDFFPACLV